LKEQRRRVEKTKRRIAMEGSNYEAVVRRLPRGAGVYALVIGVPGRREVRVGALGTLSMRRGYYTYVGSARGAGGVRARVGRHLRSNKTMRWHIDYLTAESSVTEVWLAMGDEPLEHRIADVLRGMSGSGNEVRGFGCSDCRCGSHLFWFEKVPKFEEFRAGSQAMGMQMTGRIEAKG